MSQRSTTIRQNLIINKIRSEKQVTFREISDYLQRESYIQEENFTTSKRTFIRDLTEIGEIYGIYIKYDFSVKKYFIEEDFSDEHQNRRLEALDVFNALKIKERQKNHIFLDNRQSAGTEYIYGLLHAINNQLQISFDYQTFHHQDAVKRTVNPFVIKEFKYRWYLFAKMEQRDMVKCYALDRMSNLQISSDKFEQSADFDLTERLKYCFGIISPNAEQPSEIVLSFEPNQGKYVKSLPLHHTQQILVENISELCISLKMYLTDDFIMELLSYGNTVKVIQPQNLINKMKKIYKKSMENY